MAAWFDLDAMPARTWVYVTGTMTNAVGGTVIATYRYDADTGAVELPMAFYPTDWASTTLHHKAAALAIDPKAGGSGFPAIYVVGEVQNANGSKDYAVLKYNQFLQPHTSWPNLLPQNWGLGARRYNRGGSINDVGVDVVYAQSDETRYVIALGTTRYQTGNDDITTVWYDDATGAELHADHYDGPGQGGADILLPALAAAQCRPTWTAFPLTSPNRGTAAFALAVHDEDGAGPLPPALYAAEMALKIADHFSRVGRYDGWAWSTVPNLNDESVEPGGKGPYDRVIAALLSHQGDGALNGLFACGTMAYTGRRTLSERMVRLRPGRWAGVDGGVSSYPLTLGAFDEDAAGPQPPSVFVGGYFMFAGGDPSIRKISRWDGERFSALGGGAGTHTDESVQTMAVHDEDGPGPAPPALFAAGYFRSAGGVPVRNLARWDGVRWSSLGEPGSGPNSLVFTLCAFDEDGSGPGRPALFVGGTFTHVLIGPVLMPLSAGLVRWDGNTWSGVAGLTGGQVTSMTVFDDDGPGPNLTSLFVSGAPLTINGQYVNSIVRWDGREWHRLEVGFTGFPSPYAYADEMCVFDEDGDAGPNPGGLWCCGTFSGVNGLQSIGLARWGCPLPAPCYADCDQSTGPRVIDALDFLCFMQRFEAADPSACDCDASTGPRVCDIFDFLCFQNAFAAGCP